MNEYKSYMIECNCNSSVEFDIIAQAQSIDFFGSILTNFNLFWKRWSEQSSTGFIFKSSLIFDAMQRLSKLFPATTFKISCFGAPAKIYVFYYVNGEAYGEDIVWTKPSFPTVEQMNRAIEDRKQLNLKAELYQKQSEVFNLTNKIEGIKMEIKRLEEQITK